jgi:hypothetical protein
MINLHTLTQTDYAKLIAKLLLNAEEDRNDPYLDSIGHVTIGRGFDIEQAGKVRNEVFKTLGLNQFNLIRDPDPNKEVLLHAKERNYVNRIIVAIGTYNTDSGIQTALNKIMSERAQDSDFSNFPHITSHTSFHLTDAEIETTFQNLSITHISN